MRAHSITPSPCAHASEHYASRQENVEGLLPPKPPGSDAYEYAEITSLTKKDRNNNKKTFSGKMKWGVGLMIDRDIAEKGYENKVGMSN